MRTAPTPGVVGYGPNDGQTVAPSIGRLVDASITVPRQVWVPARSSELDVVVSMRATGSRIGEGGSDAGAAPTSVDGLRGGASASDADVRVGSCRSAGCTITSEMPASTTADNATIAFLLMMRLPMSAPSATETEAAPTACAAWAMT